MTEKTLLILRFPLRIFKNKTFFWQTSDERKEKTLQIYNFLNGGKEKKTFISQTLSRKKEKKVFDNKKLYVEIWCKNADNQLNEEVSVKLHPLKQSVGIVNQS